VKLHHYFLYRAIPDLHKMRQRCVQLEWLRRNDHIFTTFIAKINKAVRMWFPPYKTKSLSIWLMLRAWLHLTEQHRNGYLLSARWLSNNTNVVLNVLQMCACDSVTCHSKHIHFMCEHAHSPLVIRYHSRSISSMSVYSYLSAHTSI
jgi:hypothetical protein